MPPPGRYHINVFWSAEDDSWVGDALARVRPHSWRSRSPTKQGDGAGGSPYAGKVMEVGELKDLLAMFGMMVGLDTSPGADTELQVAQLGHALVGVIEAHATRAEEAYRAAGAGPADLVQASLMAFAGVNCQTEVDELALINWRATRLAGVLGALDFGGPFPRQAPSARAMR